MISRDMTNYWENSNLFIILNNWVIAAPLHMARVSMQWFSNMTQTSTPPSLTKLFNGDSKLNVHISNKWRATHMLVASFVHTFYARYAGIFWCIPNDKKLQKSANLSFSLWLGGIGALTKRPYSVVERATPLLCDHKDIHFTVGLIFRFGTL